MNNIIIFFVFSAHSERTVAIFKPPLVVGLFLQMNTGTARLVINNTLSPRISMESGVKQRDPLSPTLFLLCLAPLLENQHHKDIPLQAHADDTTLLLRSRSDLQEARRPLMHTLVPQARR